MEGQSVVLRAEKGKLRLLVDDEESGGKQEMVYDVTDGEEKKDRSHGTTEREEVDGKAREAEGEETGDGRQQERAKDFGSYGSREMPCGTLSMDRKAQTRGGMPGVRGGVEFIEPMAESGDGGDAHGTSASGCGGQGCGVEPASCGIVGAEDQRRGDEGVRSAFGQTSREPGGQARGVEGGHSREEGLTILKETEDGGEETRAQ